MNRSTRTWWLVYAGCVAFVLVAMLGLTVLLLHMERHALAMRAEADRVAEIRAALWDMESWLVPHLGREESRPAIEYLPYMPAQHVYTRFLSEIAPGDVFSPSPLLSFESEYFPIHFEIHDSGAITSPQVPQGNELDLAQATVMLDGWIERKIALLEGVSAILGFEGAAIACGVRSLPPGDAQTDDSAQAIEHDEGRGLDPSESRNTQQDENSGAPSPPTAPPQQTATGQSRQEQQFTLDSPKLQHWRAQQDLQRRTEAQEWSKEAMDRHQYANFAPQSQRERTSRVGRFIPVWIDDADDANETDQRASTSAATDPRLVFLREVVIDAQTRYQGFLCDWPRIRVQLANQSASRFERIEIVPLRDDDAGRANESSFFRLASIPAEVRCAEPLMIAMPRWTPARTTLMLAWIVVISAIAITGLTLRSTIDFAHRRNRFASAVTHELRTPLTTFRMYSEMLADGMIVSPQRQREYYETLREESARLSAIVENVMAYARVEEGRSRLRRETFTIDNLLDRIIAGLERIALRSDATLNVDRSIFDGSRKIVTDVECVEQILTNLVDNACKYGCDDVHGANIDLTVEVDDGRLVFSVCDDGPGIDPASEKSIFQPFERGRIEPGSATPGVGLGLAISRGLAVTLGGTLILCRSSNRLNGPCFVLSIPMIGSSA